MTPDPGEGLDGWLAGAAALLDTPLPPTVHAALRASLAEARETRSVTRSVDRVIAAIDAAIHACLDEVLHAPAFQRLEAAWRGLAYVVERASVHENVRLSVWSWSKEDFARDFEEASEPTRTRTFAEIFTAEYGVLGGAPYGAILADISFGPGAADVGLLRQIAGVAARAHAPFFASPSPRLLGLDSFRELPDMTDVRSAFEGPGAAAWSAFRDEPDARYVGLLLPRCLVRRPYEAADEDVPFGYAESVGGDGAGLLWGSPTFPFAARLAATFARHGTLSAVVGDDEDSPDGPATRTFRSLGPAFVRPPVEVVVSARIERMLRDVGLITLLHRKGTRALWFPSANSLQVPRRFGSSDGGAAATLSYLLGTQFPYLLLACRIAHYVKVIERDMIGAARTALEIQRELEGWLSTLVNGMDSLSSEDRARFPLRHAEVSVGPDPSAVGWLRADLKIRPHVRYLGSVFTLNLSSWLGPTAGSPDSFADCRVARPE